MSDLKIQEAEVICQCFQVTDTTIKACIQSQDLKSIEDVTDACGAGGGCQSCHLLIQLFLDQHNKKEILNKEPTNGNGKVNKRGFFSKLFSKY